MKKLLLAALYVCAYTSLVFGQAFPSRVATDSDLLVSGSIMGATLNAPMGTADTSASFTQVTGVLVPNMVVTIDAENILVGSVSGSLMMGLTRGYAGSTAGTHLNNALVRNLILPVYHDVLRQEVESIEGVLASGGDTSIVGGKLRVTSYGAGIQPDSNGFLPTNKLNFNPALSMIQLSSVQVLTGGTCTAGAPTLALTGGIGSGAVIQAVMASTAIASISVIDPGVYTSPATGVTVTGACSGVSLRPVFPAKATLSQAEPLRDRANVKTWGAKGLGAIDSTSVTAETTAVQACYDFAYTQAKTTGSTTSYDVCRFPAGRYVVNTINPHGVSTRGTGRSETVIQGTAGHDVFADTDPADSGFRQALQSPKFTDLTINVDMSSDVSGSFSGNRTTGAGTAASTTWNIGNCAFAVPNRGGAAINENAGYGYNQTQFDNVTIQGVNGSGSATANTCGVFSQAPMNEWHFNNLIVRGVEYGVVDAIPTINNTGLFASDATIFSHIAFYVNHGLIYYNGSHVGLHDVHFYVGCYAGGWGYGPFILAQPDPATPGHILNSPGGWEVDNLYVETCSTATDQLGQVDGGGHKFDTGSLKQDQGSAGGYVQWNAGGSVMTNMYLGDGAPTDTTKPVLIVTGRQNIIDASVNNYVTPAWIVRDNGGNIISLSGPNRKMAGSETHRNPLYTVKGGDAIMSGNVGNPFANADDLFLSREDLISYDNQGGLNGNSFCSSVGVDATAPITGTYCSYTNNGTRSVNFIDGLTGGISMPGGSGLSTASARIPKGMTKVVLAIRAASAATMLFTITDSSNTNLGSATLNLTTSFTVQSFWIDTSASSGTYLNLRPSTASINPLNIDYAWIAFQPLPVDTYQVFQGVQTLTMSSVSLPTFDFRNGPLIKTTLTASLSGNITPTGIAAGQRIGYQFIQAASGSPFAVTWPAAFKGGGPVSTVLGSVSTQWFRYDGANFNAETQMASTDRSETVTNLTVTGTCTGCGGGGGGSGASSVSQLLDEQAIVASGVVTVGANCSATAICNDQIGSRVVAFNNAMTGTPNSAGSSGVAYIYVDKAGVRTIGSTVTTTVVNGTFAAGIANFPSGASPIAQCTITSNSFDTLGCTDRRSAFGATDIEADAGALVSQSSGQWHVGVDFTSVLSNPMTTLGDILIAGTGGAAARLAAGTSGYQLTSNGSGVAPSWQASGGGGGSGASSVSQLLDQAPLVASGVLTIGTNCSATAICNNQIGSRVVAFNNAMTGTPAAAGTSGVAYVYIDKAGVRTIGSTVTTTVVNGTFASGVSSFPSGSTPIAQCTITSNSFDTAGCTDRRAAFGATDVEADPGALVSQSSGQWHVGADFTVISQRVSVPGTSSTACTVGQMAWDTNNAYFCVATNTWKRTAALSTF